MNLHSELVSRSRHLQGFGRPKESCGGRGEAAPPPVRCSGRRRAPDWAGREARGVVCSLQSGAERARLRRKPSAARKSERESDRGAPSKQRGEGGAEQGGSSSGPRLSTGQASVSAAAGEERSPRPKAPCESGRAGKRRARALLSPGSPAGDPGGPTGDSGCRAPSRAARNFTREGTAGRTGRCKLSGGRGTPGIAASASGWRWCPRLLCVTSGPGPRVHPARPRGFPPPR